MNKQFIIINNRAYDTITGLPIGNTQLSDLEDQASTDPRPTRGIKTKSIHQSYTQSSTTLSRRHTPRPKYAINDHQAVLKSIGSKDFAKINHFATQKSTPAIQPQQTPTQIDRPAQPHPIIERVKGKQIDFSAPRNKRFKQQKLAMQNTQESSLLSKNSPKPARELKNEAIHRVLQQDINSQKISSARSKSHKKFFSGWSKILPAGLAIMLLGGYLTFLSMPNISIRMASIQSGVNAKYPNYQPNGYTLSGPIALKNGEVSMKFAYADGNQSYTLTQQKSNWDSSAVRQYVDSKNQNAIITQSNGLTIYTYDNNAAWVNGGVLYTLEGDAPLSSNQIQRIATSM